jgi:hypothetical protein
MTKLDLDATIELMLSTTLAPFATSLEQNPGVVIQPKLKGLDTANRAALELLQQLGAGDEAVLRRKLKLEETIGEGGMGVVHLATQRTIGRKVAVKTLRQEHRHELAALKLLREGWVIGLLEHPNIVPVHDIGLDAHGMPLIVLKRIEGTHWGELITDAERVQERFGVADLLEWNLGILMHVCNAISYAHSRGIVHRDLKPENVMVGEFGQVYVVDWGIAVSLRDDGSGRLPLAATSNDPAGTPYYMAPELMNGEPATERTDVYLLGAILHEILSGRPPHVCKNLRELLRSVLASRPDLPADAPPELSVICRRAMAPEPEDRFESVEAMQQQLRDHLQHQGSIRLARRAGQPLAELVEAARVKPGSGAEPAEEGAEREDEDQRRLRLYRLYSECRFGYREALGAWSDNTRAREGLDLATEVMVAYEIAHDEPRAAEALLADLDQPAPRLQDAVRSARAASEAQQHKIEAMAEVGRQMDQSVGQRRRFIAASIVFLLWCLGPLAAVLAIRGPLTESYVNMIVAESLMLVVVVAVGFVFARRVERTKINRRLFGMMAFLMVATLVQNIVLSGMEVPVVTGLRLKLFLWFAMSGMMAILLEWRFFPAVLGYLAGAGLSILWPEGRYFIITGCHLLMGLNVAAVWLPRRRDEATPSSDLGASR